MKLPSGQGWMEARISEAWYLEGALREGGEPWSLGLSFAVVQL